MGYPNFNEYVQGSLVLVTVQFTNPTGVLTDPTAAVVSVEDAAGNVTTPPVTHVSTGVYTAVVDTTSGAPGNWHYRGNGTGAVQAVAQGTFVVLATQFV